MYAGMCKFYETHEERIIRQTREALKKTREGREENQSYFDNGSQLH
jgi:hypothetical protein